LGVVAFVFAIAYLLVRWRALDTGRRGLVYDAFDLDGEGNLPTFFSAACLARVAVHAARMGDTKERRQWTALAVVFGWLSLDEGLALHERIAARALEWTHAGGVSPLFVWGGGAVLCVSLGVFFLPFVLRMSPPLRRATIACALVYVGGALGVETLAHAWARAHGWDNWVYTALVLLEETAEMAGAIAFGSVIVYARSRASVASSSLRRRVRRRRVRPPRDRHW
jgi:hypothetical protein